MRRRQASRRRLALYGAGMISGAHAAAAVALGWRVTAVASRTTVRARQRAAPFGAAVMAYDELIAAADADVADVVVVSTPPDSHATDVLALLDAGWRVVVEKPLCTTLADADRVVEAAARPGHAVLYAENLAYAPVVQALLRQAPDVAAAAPLTHLQASAIQGLPTWGGFTDESWGGGALFDLGAHPIAVVLLVATAARLGRPLAVRGELAGSSTGAHATDEWGRAHIELGGGLVASVTASWRDGPVGTWDVQLASATGVLRAELSPTIELERDGEPVPVTASPTEPPMIGQLGYAGQLAAFAYDVDRDVAPLTDARFGRDVLEVICAAYRSAGLGGEPVALGLTDRRDATPLELWRSSTP